MDLSWPVVSQLIRYGVVGLLTNFAGYLVYLFVTWIWLEPKVAVSLLYPVGVIIGYFGHARYSFAYQGGRTSPLCRYLIAHAVGFGANLALLHILADRLHYPHQAVQAGAIFVVAGLLFLLFKFFVFPPVPSGGPR